jgi:hypothetical protein
MFQDVITGLIQAYVTSSSAVSLVVHGADYLIAVRESLNRFIRRDKDICGELIGTKSWSYGGRLDLRWGEEQLKCCTEKWVVVFERQADEANVKVKQDH